MTTTALSVSESRQNNVLIVRVAGRIDSSNAIDLSSRLKELLSSGVKAIVVDLASVLYLTSAAFRALLIATDEAERSTAKLVLSGVAGHVRELFEMGGLLEVFTILPSSDDAVASLSGPAA